MLIAMHFQSKIRFKLSASSPPRLWNTRAPGTTISVILGALLVSCSSAIPRNIGPPTATPRPQSELANTPAQKLPVLARFTVNDRLIELEVARTSRQKALGLMHRTALADDRGMVFIFEHPQPVQFWMKNVRIPLDIIFLRDGQVKAIAPSVPPCTIEPCPTYRSKTVVDQVLELGGGQVAELGLKVGDRIKVEFLRSPSSLHSNFFEQS